MCASTRKHQCWCKVCLMVRREQLSLRRAVQRSASTEAPQTKGFKDNDQAREPTKNAVGSWQPPQTLKMPPQMLLNVSSSTPSPSLDTTHWLSVHLYFCGPHMD